MASLVSKGIIVLKPENVAQLVFFIRGEKVLLDADLAMLYGVEPRVLNQAVARNRKRFPADFMFQLSASEYDALTSQIVISDKDDARGAPALRSQIVISKKGRGGRRYLPYAFTEQGVAMLSSVLRSARAVEVNIAIMRTFVQLRRLMDTNRDLARKIEALEKKYDEQFAVVFEAIKQLITPPEPPRRRIGFHEP
jgi:ORF6N domain